MVLGVCRLTIDLPEAHSLKEKRRVVKSVTERVRNRFNVSIAEVDQLDVWQSAGIAFVCVSNSTSHVDNTMQTVLRFIEGNLLGGYVADIHTEVIHVA